MKLRFYLGAFFILCSLLLVACGGQTDTTSTGSASSTPLASNNPEAVMITLTDTTITSSTLTFSANQAYDFTVVNKGKSPHDLIIRRRSENFSPNGQGNEGILYIVSALQPGKTAKFHFSFPAASVNSTVQFEEHLAGLDAKAGPVTPIQVVQAR